MTAGLATAALLAVLAGATPDREIPFFIGAGGGWGWEAGRGTPSGFNGTVRAGIDFPLTHERLSAGVLLPLRVMSWSGQDGETEWSELHTSFVPTFRFKVRLVRELRAYADLGAGMAYVMGRLSSPRELSLPTFVAPEVNATFGLDYTLDRRFALFVEPAGLRLWWRSPTMPPGTAFTVTAGAHLVFGY